MVKNVKIWALSEAGKVVMRDNLSGAIPKSAKVSMKVIAEEGKPFTLLFFFYGRRWDLIPMFDKSTEFFIVDFMKDFKLNRGVDYEFSINN